MVLQEFAGPNGTCRFGGDMIQGKLGKGGYRVFLAL